MSDQQKQGIIKSFVHNELVSVLTTQPINRFLDYKVPFGGLIQGSFVEVPLGPRKVIGVVWGPGQGGYDPKKIRSISNILEIAPMHPEMQEFLTRVGRYTLTSLNAMLRLATRAPGLGDPPSMRKVYALGDAIIDRMTPAREKVLATLKNTTDMRFTAHELKEEAGVSLSVIKGLVAQNAIIEL